MFTSGFILEPLNRLEQVLFLVQLALKKGVPLNDVVHPLLEVLQRHDGSPGTSREDGPNNLTTMDYCGYRLYMLQSNSTWACVLKSEFAS